MTLYGQEHIDRYVATDGKEGHDWQGTQTLILTTTGRRSGQPRRHALIYGRHDDDYLVVASKGGAAHHPAWYLNLDANPEVEIQVKGDKMRPRAHGSARGEGRALADHDEGVARLRPLPGEHRPRHPGRRPRAPVVRDGGSERRIAAPYC